jgi:hypothetical protein
MPPKSTLDFFSFGAGRRVLQQPVVSGVLASISQTTADVGASSSVLLPAPHLASSQLPLRERILQQGNRGLFLDHKQRAMAIAFDPSSSVIVETMEFRLMCSYSQTRMTIPVRSDSCHHLQCCDLDSWVSLFAKFKAMRDPAAPCPVCNQRILLSTLRVDEWMAVVLRNLPNAKLVLLSQDGTYRSGDTHRVVKRQREEEIVLVTQCSEERDDDCDAPLKLEPEANLWTGGESSTETQDDRCPPAMPVLPFQVKMEPGAGGRRSDTERLSLGDVSSSTVSRPPHQDRCELPTVAAVIVPCATVPEGAVEKSESKTILMPLDTNECVHLSYAVASQNPRRVVPAGWRRWTPYCGRCQAYCAPVSDDDAQVQYDGDDAMFDCPRCRCSRPRCSWPAVRTFMKRRTSMHWQAPSAETAAQGIASAADESSITLDITEDNTVIISGHRLKAGLLGHYLLRGGFTCSENEGEAIRAADLDSQERVVWFSSLPLPKAEVDFLETVCDAVAQGEDPIEFNGVAPFRFKFRYEKKLQQSQWGGNNNNEGMYTAPPSQQQYSLEVPSPIAAPVSLSFGGTSMGSRSGSFRIQISR